MNSFHAAPYGMPISRGGARVLEELHLVSLRKHQSLSVQKRGRICKQLLLELTINPSSGDESRNNRFPFVSIPAELVGGTALSSHSIASALRSVLVRRLSGSGASIPNPGTTLVAKISSCSRASPSGMTA